MAVIYVTNPGNDNDIKPNLQTAINSAATSGDTIVLPAGTFAYSGSISTTKSFTLKGATQAKCAWNNFLQNYAAESSVLSWELDPQTIIYRTEATSDASLSSVVMITWTKSNRNPCGIIVSDIEFRSKIPSDVGAPTDTPTPRPASDGFSLAEDYALKFNKCTDFIVTRCKFKYFGNAAVRVDHYDDTARGLIYKCDFYKNAKGKDGLGLGYGVVIYGEDLDWGTPSDFGSNNFIFVENCTFNLHRHSVAAGGCARYVTRNNYVQDNLITLFRSCQAFDAHGSRGGSPGNGNYHSTRCVEAYNNKIINTRYYTSGTSYLSGAVINTGNTAGKTEDDLIERGIWLKECENLTYNNIIFGFRFGTGVQMEYPNQFGTGYPQLYTMGYASGVVGGSGTPNGNDQDSWMWNNTVHIFNGSCANFYNNSPSVFTNNRDYHLSAYTYTSATASAYAYPHPLRITTNEVTVSTPNNGLNFPTNSPIALTAATYNFPGTVAGVEFFVNNVSLGTATTATYTKNFTPTTAGTYTLKAIGTDISGNSITSNPFIFSAYTATGCGGFSTTILGNIPLKYGSTILSSTTLSLSITAGTIPFTYLWSNGSSASTITISPSSTTIYSVTITDNIGCTTTGSTTINVEDIRCNGTYVKTTLTNYVGGATRIICLPNPVTNLIYSHLKENPNRNSYYPTIGT